MRESSTPVHVVVPAYNEGQRIVATVETIGAQLAQTRPGSHLCVVDDGSVDDTGQRAQEAGARLPEGIGFSLLGGLPNRGKGHAVRLGALEATLPLVLFSDADLSTPFEELDRLASALAEGGFDVAIGSRSIRGASVEVRQPLFRVLMGKTFNKVMRAFTLLPVIDSQCGFKLFRREISDRLFRASVIDGFAFDVELLYLAQRAGFTLTEVPVRWIDCADSSVHPVRDSARMLRDLARIRWIHRATRV